MPMKKGYSDETFVKNLKTELGMGKPKKAGKPMPKKK
jgi:hypothetical protein